MDDTDIETNDTNHANTAEKAVDLPTEWSAPPRRDPVTGKFIKGTGGSLKGGRPKGSKDRVSKAMVDLATELVANRGTELFEAMADRDPAQALALVAKIVPPEEMRAVFQEEREPEKGKATEVTINLVASPSPRLSDSRTQGQIEDQQRGLTAPVERLTEPSEDAVVATQDDADELAAEAERERVRRQNEALKAHGELTGRARRTEVRESDIQYRDSEDWI